MTACPACHKEEYSGAQNLPPEVREGMSTLIDLSRLVEFEELTPTLCVNCGAYFSRSSGGIIETPEELLSPSADCVADDLWADLLALPPELLRLIANECRLGNRVCGAVRGTEVDGWLAFYVDGYFRDGHMVSSWTEQHSQFADGLDLSCYVCETAKVAVCSTKSQAEQVVADQRTARRE